MEIAGLEVDQIPAPRRRQQARPPLGDSALVGSAFGAAAQAVEELAAEAAAQPVRVQLSGPAGTIGADLQHADRRRQRRDLLARGRRRRRQDRDESGFAH